MMVSFDDTARVLNSKFYPNLVQEITLRDSLETKRQLGDIYGINRTTINEWIKKYNRKDLMNTRILVETQDETTRIKALQKEIKQLKDLLIKKELDKLVIDSYLEVASEKLGYKNVDDLKKNLNI